MGRDQIDASLGLAFSLAVFEQYRQGGLLQAELHHVPGFRGRCKGFLHLVEGKVVSCYLEDMHSNRYIISSSMLSYLDAEKGPFEWILTPVPAHPTHTTQAIPLRPITSSPTPRRIAKLNLEKLDGWTYKQKLMLSLVFDVINGQRTIEDIKSNTPLPPYIVEEALRVLLAMKVIIISP